jgi:uncharacterized protein
MSQTLTSADFAAYVDSWNAARERREQHRRDPYGYLSYAAFHKLNTVPRRFAGIPGNWRTGPDGPTVVLEDGEELTVDDEVVTGAYEFGPVREREFRRAAHVDDVVIELSKRGGQDLLRPIDPSFGRRISENYDHTPAYEPDPRWIVEGEFIPFETLQPTRLDATIGDIVHTHPAIGEVVFLLAGVEQRLLVFARDDQQVGVAGTGFTAFTDATGGVTTDPAGRSLEVDFPEGRGPVTLDFNYVKNFQRPYTKFSPCLLPPERNYLTVPVHAGEQLPIFR